MNSSELKARAYGYLSHSVTGDSALTDTLIDGCLHELSELAPFRYITAEYDTPLDFLTEEPYAAFLTGGTGYFLIAGTLGAEVSRRIKRLYLTDMARALVYDACAGAYLELEMERVRDALGSSTSYIFCPGYQGSRVSDLRYILSALKAEKIGITLTDTCLMLPEKSMAGIIAKGTAPTPSCRSCARASQCELKKEGKQCFHMT